MQNQQKKDCFTLIELLVVIAIIAILAGLLMPAVKSVWGQGKKTQAQADVHALRMAISAYENTYQVYPGPGPYETTETGTLLKILTGDGNKRGIRFLETRSDGTFDDPWDQPYNVVLDHPDYDGKVDVGGEKETSIAVWSIGPNGVDDKGEDDDIASWHD